MMRLVVGAITLLALLSQAEAGWFSRKVRYLTLLKMNEFYLEAAKQLSNVPFPPSTMTSSTVLLIPSILHYTRTMALHEYHILLTLYTGISRIPSSRLGWCEVHLYLSQTAWC